MSAELPNPHQLRKIMIDTQIRPADVTKFTVIDAMQATPRERYLPKRVQNIAYIGKNIPLDESRVLLEPRISAKMLDALNIKRDEAVLDIGCAFGYSAALLACFSDIVIAVEENPKWAERAYENLSAHALDHVVLHNGVLAEGAMEHGPYNAIIIEGAIEVLPDIISAQLAEGGRICAIFADGYNGVVRLGQKSSGSIIWRFLFNASAPVLPGFFKEAGFKF